MKRWWPRVDEPAENSQDHGSPSVDKGGTRAAEKNLVVFLGLKTFFITVQTVVGKRTFKQIADTKRQAIHNLERRLDTYDLRELITKVTER